MFLDKDEIKKELYAHAVIYYKSVEVELTEDMICALFPNQCVSYEKALDVVNSFLQEAKDHTESVEIGGGTTVKGFEISEDALKMLYNWIWFRY